MNAISYSDVFDLQSEPADAEAIAAGDLVRTGPNLHPHFAVIAVHGEKAWLRNIQSGQDALVPVARCRRLLAGV